ncbi:methylated-DNA--[protein]-cysteine S-methyltransferase [Mycobacterium deserti]|uniref:Methylated-DNA--protein-cysteine methyltransferase n=1 Tax=Mycobacterium deserti TaxID=2978347 RepID=A0ABT2MDB0_9MYCO|nr:methylated-DNA--[protein]-cysteine S-methyltransferase [Mycobacterium deserti]MCT7660254.1 methylated-DNA--[protein]-cysteine S-methyltransferase [Mycobacterium deserti]
MTRRHAMVDSALGELTLVADDGALTGVYFDKHWYRPAHDGLGRRVEADCDDVLDAARDQVTDYLAGRRTDFDLPLTLRGTEDQRRVWQMLNTIEYGATVTYGALATALADGTTAQQVGQTVGRNPLSIVVPCHRVVSRGGRLTGYAGGLARKQFLLELEEPTDRTAARLF